MNRRYLIQSAFNNNNSRNYEVRKEIKNETRKKKCMKIIQLFIIYEATQFKPFVSIRNF